DRWKGGLDGDHALQSGSEDADEEVGGWASRDACRTLWDCRAERCLGARWRLPSWLPWRLLLGRLVVAWRLCRRRGPWHRGLHLSVPLLLRPVCPVDGGLSAGANLRSAASPA